MSSPYQLERRGPFISYRIASVADIVFIFQEAHLHFMAFDLSVSQQQGRLSLQKFQVEFRDGEIFLE